MPKMFAGFDVGLTGALALIDATGRMVMIEDMPVTARGNGRVKHELYAAGLLHLLRPHAAEITFGIVERVGARPGQGVASMFSLGHSTGVIDGVLAALHIPHQTMSATKWKRLAELPAEKALVLAAARRRWPDARLELVKHHGRAEALFLALLAMRRHGGR
jgi:crossover junction endodeoxyribonuclease RuvC